MNKKAWLITIGVALFVPVFAKDSQDGGKQRTVEAQIPKEAQGLEQMTRVNPFDPVALNNHAVIKAREGDYQGALRLLERANRLDPQHADIAANLKSLRAWLNSPAGERASSMTTSSPVSSAVPPEPPPLWQNTGATSPSMGR